MGDDIERTIDTKVGRGDFLKLAAAACGGGLLAACGADEAAEPAQTQPAEAAPPPPALEDEVGDLHVFEWSGYEVPEMWEPYKRSVSTKPKFTFLTSSQQALTKMRAGFEVDLVHPCNSYINDFVQFGGVQPFDTSLIPSFADLNPTLAKAGEIDGEQWLIPCDWGFESVMYRADKVEPAEESWNLLYDERYEGRISWWNSEYNLIVAGIALGYADPWDMTDDELATVKDHLVEKKKLVRNFWSTQTDMEVDFTAGNTWIVGEAWAPSWIAAKKKGIDAAYMDPKEGRISWICGFMLDEDTKNYRHAHEYVDAWASKQSAEWLIVNYAYGHANTTADLSKADPDLVSSMHLDDPSSLERAQVDRSIARRDVYTTLWTEIKAA